MARLQLESATDTLDLDAVLHAGRGVQVQSGVSGLGLPPKQVQWLEGAGDGAIARGRRVLSRDVDLPLLVQGVDREDLKAWLSRLAMVLAGEATLRLIEDDGSSWYTRVEHVGGGQYVYGVDSVGETDFFTVITLRAGDPFFTYSAPSLAMIGNSVTQSGLLGPAGLASMQVASSQAMGSVTLENLGDAKAYPVWTISGPGENFQAVSPTGEVLQWNGVLTAGQTLTIDTKTGMVYDQTGANRYASLAPAPRFWTIPPGTTTATAMLTNTTPGQSLIKCEWRPRKWMVV